MFGRGHNLAAEESAHAVNHALATGRGLEYAALADLHVRVAGKGVADVRTSHDNILDFHSPSRVGIDHERLSDNALRKTVESEGGDGADDGLGRLARDPLLRHARPELLLHLVHGLLASL